MTDNIVKFEVGALYYIAIYGQHLLTLYLGFHRSTLHGPLTGMAHIFYICNENKHMHFSNTNAVRMGKYITKVKTDVA